MPFDGKIMLTRLEKLERLKMLADKATGEQGSFCTCLHHDAMADPILAATGLPDFKPVPLKYHHRVWELLYEWVGDFRDAERLFGMDNIQNKRRYLADLIAREKAARS